MCDSPTGATRINWWHKPATMVIACIGLMLIVVLYDLRHPLPVWRALESALIGLAVGLPGAIWQKRQIRRDAEYLVYRMLSPPPEDETPPIRPSGRLANVPSLGTMLVIVAIITWLDLPLIALASHVLALLVVTFPEERMIYRLGRERLAQIRARREETRAGS